MKPPLNNHQRSIDALCLGIRIRDTYAPLDALRAVISQQINRSSGSAQEAPESNS